MSNHEKLRKHIKNAIRAETTKIGRYRAAYAANGTPAECARAALPEVDETKERFKEWVKHGKEYAFANDLPKKQAKPKVPEKQPEQDDS